MNQKDPAAANERREPPRLPLVDARRIIAIGFDLGCVAASWVFCYAAAFWFTLPPEAVAVLLQTLPVVVASHLACFAAFRLYRGIWRFASLHDLRQIAKAVGFSLLCLTILLFLWRRAELIPRATLALHPVLLLVLMCGGRIGFRWWKELRSEGAQRAPRRPVLILGANEPGYRLILLIAGSPQWHVVGLLDDSPTRARRMVAGFPVMGTWDELARVASQTGVGHVLLPMNGTSHAQRRRAFDLCARAGLKLLVVPDIDAMMSEGFLANAIRKIEVDDLLGRDPVNLDVGGLRQMLAAGTVLVTGAGGTIGAELCRQIARFQPARIVLLEAGEFALYQIEQELARDFPDIETVPVIADVKDPARVEEVFASTSPRVVFHAAAYKHVPLMETLNAWQAVLNNTLGTVRVLEAIARHPVEHFVFVSTDKAVNPTSVMGATKRLAEMLLQQWASRVSGARLVTVRFGNVLGSTGSVVPKFREQIARGGPITITHPDIKRYFMSVSEAAQLVMQAAHMGAGGEIFVLEMGEPVRIVDLARDMVSLSGLPEDAIRIEFTGLRPGEKLFEELLANDETTLPTRHPKLRVSRPMERPGDGWEREVMDWMGQPTGLSDDEVRSGLARFVPEYRAGARPVVDNVVPLRGQGSARAAA